MPEERLPQKLMNGKPGDAKTRGRLRLRWLNDRGKYLK